jgi:hypothetical protein
MNPLEYGKLIDQIDNKYWIQINERNSVIINQLDDYNEIRFFRSGILVYTWKDKIIDNNSFNRVLGKKEFIFKDNELQIFKTLKPAKFINSIDTARKY